MSNFASLSERFETIPDPRISRARLHKLSDILLMTVIGVLCGANGWKEVHLICFSLEDWLTKLLGLENGIPSEDTFRRVIERIPAKLFQSIFVDWVNSIADLESGEIVAIDGKRIRGSFDRASQAKAIHMLNAYAVKAGLVMANCDVDAKTNEITKIPDILDCLVLKGCIVTLDAMGCQTDICQKIMDSDADYTIGLKGNQGNIHEEVKEYFDLNSLEDLPSKATTDKGHGRIEIREYFSANPDQISSLENWPGIGSIIMVRSTRIIGEDTSNEQRYYLSSLLPERIDLSSDSIRQHWGVESLHWILDNTFREDDSRIRDRNSAQTISTIRKMTANILNHLEIEKKPRETIKGKRLLCMGSTKIREKALGLAG